MYLNPHKVIKAHFQLFLTQMDQGSILPGLKKGVQPTAAPTVITALLKTSLW